MADFTDFEKLRIKVYDNWDLFLHVNQYPYLGRVYAWAHREDASQLRDMNIDSRNELFDAVVPQWERTVRKLFQSDWTNAACLGNTSPHLHWHLIPRYNSPRKFEGIEFVDSNPRGNYSPYAKKEIPMDVLLKIREEIVNGLK